MTQRWALVLGVLLIAIVTVFIWDSLQDDTVILGNTSGNENGILVSGQGSTGVLADQRFTSGSNSLDVGRLTPSSGRNEVVGFTNSRPVAIQSPAAWTSGSDTINLPFANEIQIAVTIWIVEAPFSSQSQKAMNRCIAVAAMWTAERMGVAFAPGGCDVRDATISTKVAFNNCDNPRAFQNRFGITPNRINMYVVDTVNVLDGATTGGGTTCGTSDFAALGATADAGLAIHELGHNFSLTHVDTLPDFDSNNIMYSASSTRQYFTEGQLFRAHFTPAVASTGQPGSALNSVYLGARAGQPTRDCNASPCPNIDKRIWADGALPAN